MRLASPLQSFDLKEEKTEAEACFVSAETTVTAAVDLRLSDAKKPGLHVSKVQGGVSATAHDLLWLRPRIEPWENSSANVRLPAFQLMSKPPPPLVAAAAQARQVRPVRDDEDRCGWSCGCGVWTSPSAREGPKE